MKWKQFFTPVESIDWPAAEKLLRESKSQEMVLLDVRQPKEYQEGHLAGATLIPLGDLDNRLRELDKDTPTIVYCAIGGRSRVAAQMLSGKGFNKVYNLSGGIKGASSPQAQGDQEVGLALFTGQEDAAEVIVIGLGLERGLQDFYESMQKQLNNREAIALFAKLAEVEIIHQQHLTDLYAALTGNTTDLKSLLANVVDPAMEGGLTTKEYLDRYHPDLESMADICSLAMAIEAQALDLYQRASVRAENREASSVLADLAAEERTHMAKLAKLLDSFDSGA